MIDFALRATTIIRTKQLSRGRLFELVGMLQFGTEVWHRRATSLALAVKILLRLVVVETFLSFDMYLNWPAA